MGSSSRPREALVERKRDGVAGEIAAPQILLNGGLHLRLGAGAGVLLLPRHGDLRRHAAGKDQFGASCGCRPLKP
jgi:hypothetical protein